MGSKSTRSRHNRRDRRLGKASGWRRSGKSNPRKVGHGGSGMVLRLKQKAKVLFFGGLESKKEEDELIWSSKESAASSTQELKNCLHCNANLIGESIPESSRELYGGATHFRRDIAVYDRWQDRTIEYRCPDCGGRWEV